MYYCCFSEIELSACPSEQRRETSRLGKEGKSQERWCLQGILKREVCRPFFFFMSSPYKTGDSIV